MKIVDSLFSKLDMLHGTLLQHCKKWRNIAENQWKVNREQIFWEGDKMFNLTESARTELAEALEKERRTEDEQLYVRISMGVGWGGPQLRLTLEEQPLETDKVFSFDDDVNVVINERDKSYFENMQLDYKKDVFGFGGFTLINQ